MNARHEYKRENDEIAEVALTHPNPGLFEALWKKLNAVDRARLRQWIEEEHRAAAAAEWERQKHRIPEEN